jgi:hypothetical protein
MRAAQFRGGAIHAGRGYRGGVRPGYPIAGRPGRPIAGYAGGGYYRPGWGVGAAAVGAATAAGAYGYYNGYNNNYNNNCGYDTYGNWVCPQQYPY